MRIVVFVKQCPFRVWLLISGQRPRFADEKPCHKARLDIILLSLLLRFAEYVLAKCIYYMIYIEITRLIRLFKRIVFRVSHGKWIFSENRVRTVLLLCVLQFFALIISRLSQKTRGTEPRCDLMAECPRKLIFVLNDGKNGEYKKKF